MIASLGWLVIAAACGGSGGNDGEGVVDASTEVDAAAGDVDAAGGEACGQPEGVEAVTLHDVWQADPDEATAYWIEGVFVTAVTGGGCEAETPCSIFVQQAESFEDLAAGSQQALRVRVAASEADGFDGIAVGDEIDLLARGLRSPPGEADELLLLVDATQPGCANVVGSGDPQPVEVTLDDLSASAYLDTVGPLLVSVSDVTGDPNTPPEPFALWETGTVPDDPIENVKSLHPSCLDGAAFTGLTQGVLTDFTSVTGTFGIQWEDPTPFLEIYVRTTADYPH